MGNNDLTPASPDLVWKIYSGLSEECRHFNGLQSTYRSLASTWLLATFAGIGFVLKDIHTPYSHLFIGGIALAGALGILMLWLLDLKVYHLLLAAAFAEQLRLERKYDWLPRMAHSMMAGQKGQGVVAKVVWFYILAHLLLVGVCALALAHPLTDPAQPALPSLLALLFFLVLGVGPAFLIRRDATRYSLEHEHSHGADPANGAA